LPAETLLRFFDFGQSIFQLHGLYNILITNYGNITAALNPIWTINMSIFWAGLVYASVQGFFAYRIKVLSRSYAIPVICWLAILIRFSFNSFATIMSVTMTLFEFEATHINLVHGSFITGIILDNLVAASLSYYLFNRGRDAMERTRSVIRRLILFSIETGIVTSMVGTVATIMCFTMPNNAIWIGILFFHSKIYANSLMLSLNRVIPQENLVARPAATSSMPTSLRSNQSSGAPSSDKMPTYRQDVIIELSDRSYSKDGSGTLHGSFQDEDSIGANPAARESVGPPLFSGRVPERIEHPYSCNGEMGI